MKKKEQTISDLDIYMIQRFTSLQRTLDEKIHNGKNNLLIHGGGVCCGYFLATLNLDNWNIRIQDLKYDRKPRIMGVEVGAVKKENYEWADCIYIAAGRWFDEIFAEINSLGYEDKVLDCKDGDVGHEIFQYTVPLLPDDVYANKLIDEDFMKGIDKYTGWTDESAGEVYEDGVEDVFFKRVTKHYYLDYINSDSVVLDVGAGTGRLTREIAKVAKTTFAVDASKSMLSVLNKICPNVHTKVVSDEKLPFDDDSLDVLTSLSLMCHIENVKPFLKEHKRVVKSGGYIIHEFVNDNHLKLFSDDPDCRKWYASSNIAFKGHYFSAVSKDMMVELCEELGGLEIERIIPVGLFFSTGYSKGILSKSEMFALQNGYTSICESDIIGDIIKDFEREIVSKTNEDYTATNIYVFKVL